MEPMTMLAVASTTMSTASSIFGGIAEKEASYQQAELYRRTAEETLRRYEINAEIVRQESNKVIGKQVTSTAGQGKALTTSSYLLLADTASATAMQLSNMQQEAMYEANQLRLQANMAEESGRNAVMAGFLGGAAKGLGGAYDIYKNRSNDYVKGSLGVSGSGSASNSGSGTTTIGKVEFAGPTKVR